MYGIKEEGLVLIRRQFRAQFGGPSSESDSLGVPSYVVAYNAGL